MTPPRSGLDVLVIRVSPMTPSRVQASSANAGAGTDALREELAQVSIQQQLQTELTEQAERRAVHAGDELLSAFR